MTIRRFLATILQLIDGLDNPCYVQLCRRDSGNCVTEVALLDVNYVDRHGQICVEESQIVWKKHV